MSKPANIWLVTIGEPLPIEPGSRALRTRLLARELSGRGDQVLWWTSRFNHFAKQHHDHEPIFAASDEGYRIAFLDGMSYSRNLSLSRQINHVQIARDFDRKAKSLPRPDAIVCSFPPIELTQSVADFAHRHGVPLVIDVRDLWPDELRDRVPSFLSPLARPLLTGMERSVRKSFRHANALFGVSQRYRDWAVDKAGRPPRPGDEVIPLGYPDHPDAETIRRGRTERPSREAITLLFSGSFNNSVDVPCLIRAFVGLQAQEARLVICGDGEHAVSWRALAKDDQRIRFTGWVDAAMIRREAALADIGLVCYKPGSHVAMPNKLFEYMSFGLPIVNSIAGEAAALVDRSGIGLNYPAGEDGSLRRVLSELMDDAARRRAMSIRSGQVFEDAFSSETVYRRYAARIDQLLNEYQRSE